MPEHSGSSVAVQVPTPLVYEGILYIGDERGMVSALDPQTGHVHYSQERLVAGAGGRYYASPVAAGGKLYFTETTGTIHVVQAGRKFVRLADNSLGESCYATPAVSRGRLLIRTRHHLYCIGQ